MKIVAEIEAPISRRLVIERDEKVGYYLYVFEGGRCVFDYLQDTLDLALEKALREFQIPKDSWKSVE